MHIEIEEEILTTKQVQFDAAVTLPMTTDCEPLEPCRGTLILSIRNRWHSLKVRMVTNKSS